MAKSPPKKLAPPPLWATPTPAQLSGRTGLPVATCKRAIARGTWRELL